MDSEYARVSIEEIGRLKQRNRLTLLFDGWEDKIRRSLYGSVAAEVGQYPTVLSLDELTGHRGSADKYLETVKKALKNMEIENGKNLIALTTDDPTVMQSFRCKFKSEYYWVIVSRARYEVWIYPDDYNPNQTLACFLHGLNTIIRKIASYPTMKKWPQSQLTLSRTSTSLITGVANWIMKPEA